MSRTNSGTRFEAAVRSQGAVRQEFSVRFDFNPPIETPPVAAGDPWLAAMLLPAMFAEENLEIRAPVSPRLIRTVGEIQQILHCWYPAFLKRIQILTPHIAPATAVGEDNGPMAVFFSGGVDSWYSFLKHQAKLSALLTVKGFDIPFGDRAVWPELLTSTNQIAAETQKQVIAVETNLRQHVDPDSNCFTKRYGVDFWGQCMHGACLAAVGLFLQEQFSQVVIAASWPYTRLQPWGSNPLLDPLWSNGRIEFLHDGAEATRLEKTRTVSQSDLALRHLRVCCVPGAYNCCECDKCVRTMLGLHLFGVLERAARFPRPLDLKALEQLHLQPYIFPLYRDILDQAEACGNTAVARLIRILIGEMPPARRTFGSIARQLLSRQPGHR